MRARLARLPVVSLAATRHLRTHRTDATVRAADATVAAVGRRHHRAGRAGVGERAKTYDGENQAEHGGGCGGLARQRGVTGYQCVTAGRGISVSRQDGRSVRAFIREIEPR